MVPATVSQLITLNKDTTLVSIIAIQEVVRSGRVLTQTGGQPVHGRRRRRADPAGDDLHRAALRHRELRLSR
jgi:hypothetical protein